MSNQTIQVNKFLHRGQWRIGLYFSYNTSISNKEQNLLAPVKGDYNSEHKGVKHSAFFPDLKLLESSMAFRYFQYLLGEISIKIRVIFAKHTQKIIGCTFRARDHTNMFIIPVKIRTNVRVCTS